jgi:competence protein ComEA
MQNLNNPKKVNRALLVLTLLGAVLLSAALCEAAPGAKPAGKPAAGAPAAAPVPGVVNLNTATEEQLQLLPRIGPSKAKAIVKYRGRQKFKAPWDLTHVKGIGRKTFRLLRPYLVVQGETTLSTKAKVVRD